MPKPKYQQLYELFDQGKTATSPEVKALVAKSSTRNAYVSEWRKARGIKPDQNVRAVGPTTMLPKGESVQVVNRTTGSTNQSPPSDPFNEADKDDENAAHDEEEENGDEERGMPGEGENNEASHNGHGEVLPIVDQRIADAKKKTFSVAGAGLNITAVVSVKTMFLYEQAKSTQALLNPDPSVEPLSLGDFIDTCVEDFFRVRGQDAGMVNIRG